MKIRTGHVSNSSSSSFYMTIPKDVWNDDSKLREFVKEYLFNGRERLLDSYGDNVIPIDDAVKHIRNDAECTSQKNMNGRLAQYMMWIKEEKECSTMDRRFTMSMIRLYEERLSLVKQVLESMKNTDVVVVEWVWADEDGPYWSAMEHGTHPKFDKDKGVGIVRQSNH